jgi:hypothetical protein
VNTAPAGPGAELFQTEAWFQNLAAHGFVPGGPARGPQFLRLALPADEQGHSGQLPLMHLGANEPLAALANYYSGLYGPVGPGGRAPELSAAQWRVVIQALRTLPGSAVLRLQPLDAQSAWVGALEQGLCEAGYRTDRFFCFGNWYQPVGPGGFSAYWAQRPSALQNSVARGRRRLDKAGPWRIGIVCEAGPALEEALLAYTAVYARSWKAPEPAPGFMPGLVRTAAAQGWLRLGVLWQGSEPLAAQVWLVFAGKASIYKLAYVQGHEKRSVGSVLTAALMQHVIDVDRVGEVDYLSGDDTYKADWMALRRERIGLVAFDRHRLGGWLAGARHALGRLRRR